MVFKNQSSKIIISKLIRDFDIREPSLVNDMIEWIGDVLRATHVQLILIPQDKVLEVVDYKVELPCLFFHNAEVWTYDNDNENDVVKLPIAAKRRRHINEVNEYEHDYYYTVPNYLKFSFETGYVHLYYDSFPLDDCNLPLIPDVYDFEEAVSFYIIYKLLSRGYTHPVWNVQTAYQMYRDYEHRAKNRFKAPSRDDHKTLQAVWAGEWTNYLARYRSKDSALELLPDTIGDSSNQIN